jgi:hypothetical protein
MTPGGAEFAPRCSYQNRGGPLRLLAEHRMGGRWVPTTVPQGTKDGYFAAISATASDDAWGVGDRARAPADVWAVGNSRGRRGSSDALIEHWDGSSWTITDRS